MPDPVPRAELLRSLGRLTRGLSALFWGLPLTLITCISLASGGWFKSFGIALPLATTGLLLYGLLLLGRFQRQERVWRNALDRTQLLAVINLGLSPFLYWWNKVPGQPLFADMVALLAVTSLVFLSHLNLVLERLSAMLPDETLRHETRQFAPANRILLTTALILVVAHEVFERIGIVPPQLLDVIMSVVEGNRLLLLIIFVLLPLAMTLALIWKTKEVILESVFGGEHPPKDSG